MTPWAGGQNKHGVAPPACLRCSTSWRFPRGTSFGRNASVKTLTAKNHKWRRHPGKRWQNQYPGATRGADGIPPVPDQYDPVQGKGAVAFYTGSDGREIWLTALVVASVLSISLKTAKAPVG